MLTEKKHTIFNIAKIAAIVSVFFIFIVSLMLIINFIQIKKFAPIDKMGIEPLLKELAANPRNELIKQQIRTLDLLSRKAFFTNQWQLRTGGYLLLGSFILLLISLKVYLNYKPKNITVGQTDLKINFWELKSNERRWLISGVLTIVISATILYFLSKGFYDDLNYDKFSAFADTINDNESKISNAVADNSKNANTNPPETKNQKVSSEDIKDFPDDNSIKANYPGFRGPFGLGVSYCKNIPTDWDGTKGKNILWKTAIDLPGFNSPVLWGNNLFIAGADNQKKTVYCINAKTGEIIWAKVVADIPNSPTTAMKVTDDTGLSAPTLTTDGKRVFALFASGDLICFDFKGERLWAKNIGVPENHYGHSSSLIFYQNLLIIQYDHSKSRNLMALSVHTGEIKWNTTRSGRISWASPILITDKGAAQIVVSNDPYVAGYETSSGKELWKVEALSGEIGSSPAYANGIVFAANAYAKLAAIQIGGTPKVLWENNDYLPDASSPVAWKDYLFIATAEGDVACYNAKDGVVLWNHNFDNGFYASPIVVDEKIYIMDRTGVMHILKADKKYALISESKIGEKTDCTPAFSNGHIFIRTKKNLYCVGK